MKINFTDCKKLLIKQCQEVSFWGKDTNGVTLKKTAKTKKKKKRYA